MADEGHKSGGVPETVTFVVGLLVVLFALWWVRGGPQNAGGVRGLFLNAPPPVGNGESYGPGIGTSTDEAGQNQSSY